MSFARFVYIGVTQLRKPEEEVLLSAYTAQGNLSLELLEPDMKNKESDSTEHVEEETTSETVPVATPVS